MANLFLNLPVPTSNIPGAAVDVGDMGATKTVIVGGTFSQTVTIEYATDDVAAVWAPVPGGSLQNPGRVTFSAAARWMRAVTSGYRSGAASAGVGASFAPAAFIQLGPTAADISVLPAFKTVVVSGACIVEISDDGVAFSQLLAFGQAGAQSATAYGKFARVTGGVTAWMGGAEIVSDIDGEFATRIVFRPGDPLGTHDNVFVTWADSYAALQSVTGLGQVFLEFDSTFVSPVVVPFGTWDITDVILTNRLPGNGSGVATSVLVEIADGASFVTQNPTRTIRIEGYGLGIVSNRVGPVAPFLGIGVTCGGNGVKLFNTSALALPMFVWAPGQSNTIYFEGSCSRGFIGDSTQSPPCPAPLVDVSGHQYNIVLGAGNVMDGAVTDTVGFGFLNVRYLDDSANGLPGVNNMQFPALVGAGGVLGLSVEHRDRFLIDVDLATPATSPWQAFSNELVRCDTTVGAVTVNAPPAVLRGERFSVKDLIGNAAVNNITIAPQGLDIVEFPTIASNLQCKTWVADGAGTWMLTSQTP